MDIYSNKENLVFVKSILLLGVKIFQITSLSTMSELFPEISCIVTNSIIFVLKKA